MCFVKNNLIFYNFQLKTMSQYIKYGTLWLELL